MGKSLVIVHFDCRVFIVGALGVFYVTVELCVDAVGVDTVGVIVMLCYVNNAD